VTHSFKLASGSVHRHRSRIAIYGDHGSIADAPCRVGHRHSRGNTELGKVSFSIDGGPYPNNWVRYAVQLQSALDAMTALS